MSIQDQNINGVLEPDKISIWPLQPGWYMVLGLILVALAYLGWRLYQSNLKNRYKREAIKRINALSNGTNFFYQLNSLIKSVAIQSYGRKKVAGLTGKEWTTFLNNSENRIMFNSTVLNCLESHHYRKSKDVIEDAIFHAAKTDSINWIKKHK